MQLRQRTLNTLLAEISSKVSSSAERKRLGRRPGQVNVPKRDNANFSVFRVNSKLSTNWCEGVIV